MQTDSTAAFLQFPSNAGFHPFIVFLLQKKGGGEERENIPYSCLIMELLLYSSRVGPDLDNTAVWAEGPQVAHVPTDH